MILGLLFTILKILGVLVVLLIAAMTYKHKKAQAQLARFKKTGIDIDGFVGNDTFFLGFVTNFLKYGQDVAGNPEVMFPHPIRYFCDQIDKTPRRFDSAKHPLVAMNQISKVRVVNSDAQVANDLFNKHNKLTDKISETANVFEPLLGDSIIGARNDEDWRRKRKATAHGFYKDRLKHMIEVLKEQVNQKVAIWKSEISKNGGSTQINIAYEFADIFAKNLIFICFGEDIADTKIEMQFMTDAEKPAFEKRSVTFTEALNNTFKQLNVLIKVRMGNPLCFLLMSLFDIKIDFHWSAAVMKGNCGLIRSFIGDYVTARKQGKNKSKVNDVDMLSLFLETPDVFTQEFIINELMDFFFAGTVTTQFASQTILTHYVHKADSLAKARNEFMKTAKEMFPDLQQSKERSYIDSVLKIELFQELEYLSCVVNEALRYEPPASAGTPVFLSADAKLGDFQFKKGDIIANNIYGLHMNSKEWQRPFEFIPERFDNSSELSLTPDGKKRNAGAFCPFGGGMRVCLGKTFADVNIKILSIYLTQNFNFEHVDKRYQDGEFPYAHFFTVNDKPIMVKLTLNDN